MDYSAQLREKERVETSARTEQKQRGLTIVCCVSVTYCRLANSSPNQCNDYLIRILTDEETARDVKANTEADRALAERGFECPPGHLTSLGGGGHRNASKSIM